MYNMYYTLSINKKYIYIITFSHILIIGKDAQLSFYILFSLKVDTQPRKIPDTFGQILLNKVLVF